MENLVARICIFAGILGGIAAWNPALAYDGNVTHPYLTELTIGFYNEWYDTDISPENARRIIQGSRLEDISPRWMNHYYDPTTGNGWQGERMGTLTPGQALSIARAGALPLGANPVSSLEWMHARLLQLNYYGMYGGDRTWRQALDYAVDGNMPEAYKTLGHILHVIQDMSVPAHVRADAHTGLHDDPQDPFEVFAANNPLVLRSAVENAAKTFSCNSPDDCLKQMAKYANENFVSIETLDAYPKPVLHKELDPDRNRIVFTNIDGARINLGKVVGRNNIFKMPDEYLSVHWSLLAPRAIIAGAETIRAFHEAIPHAIENREFPVRLVTYDLSFFQSLSSALSPSLIGEAQKLRDRFASIIRQVAAILGFQNQPESPLPRPIAVQAPVASAVLPLPAQVPVVAPGQLPSPILITQQQTGTAPVNVGMQAQPVAGGGDGPRFGAVIQTPTSVPEPPEQPPTQAPSPSLDPSPLPSPTPVVAEDIYPLRNIRWTNSQLSFEYSRYPFFSGTGDQCQAAAFFLNAEPPSFLGYWGPAGTGFSWNIPNEPLRLMFSWRNHTWQAGQKPAFVIATEERYADPSDQSPCKFLTYQWSSLPHIAKPYSSPPWQITLDLDVPSWAFQPPSLTVSDYITVGYYGYGLGNDFVRHAVDPTRYYFSPAPNH